MIITVPVTDYIPASLLTTDGDIIHRGVAIPERIARAITPSHLVSYNVVGQPVWQALDGAVGNYYRSRGAGFFPLWSALALRDTGIHIVNSTRNAGGDQVISGVGFETSLAIFLAVDDVEVNLNWSIGFSNLNSNMNLDITDGGTKVWTQTNNCISIYRGVANSLEAVMSARDSNSITLTWTLTGACVVKFILICIP